MNEHGRLQVQVYLSLSSTHSHSHTNKYREAQFSFLSVYLQCDQIGRFNALWVTFQSLWQQLFCPNCLHFSSDIIFGQLL